MRHDQSKYLLVVNTAEMYLRIRLSWVPLETNDGGGETFRSGKAVPELLHARQNNRVSRSLEGRGDMFGSKHDNEDSFIGSYLCIPLRYI